MCTMSTWAGAPASMRCSAYFLNEEHPPMDDGHDNDDVDMDTADGKSPPPTNSHDHGTHSSKASQLTT